MVNVLAQCLLHISEPFRGLTRTREDLYQRAKQDVSALVVYPTMGAATYVEDGVTRGERSVHRSLWIHPRVGSVHPPSPWAPVESERKGPVREGSGHRTNVCLFGIRLYLCTGAHMIHTTPKIPKAVHFYFYFYFVEAHLFSTANNLWPAVAPTSVSPTFY